MQHARPAGDGRADELPPPDDYDRLKDLLLGEEREALDAAQARIAQLDRAQRELPARLPDAIERAQQGAGAERIARALAQPVTQALGAAVRENRQVIVDVLFPVIGPAIRKAIAEALRGLVADVNSAIESSFTPRGLRWRIEAWRSGVPYAQIVIKHTLAYRIDHVFLIERDSGIVLDRESAPDLPELDGDAIAGMLTAIGDFVSDSVGRDGDNTLDSARVGEHLLWVVRGPRANLACFIHGVPPAGLHALLEQRLEEIHAQFADGADAGATDAVWRSLLRPERLTRDVRDAAPAARARPSRWPVLSILLVGLGLLAFFAVRSERWNARVDELRTRLAAHPGFVLTGIEQRGRDALTVHGLLDADAEPPDAALRGAGAEVPVKLDAVGYVSTDDAVVARRARRLLDAPAGVTIAVRDGVLSLDGRAAPAWIDAARDRAGWIAGVRGVQFGVVAETDEAAIARDKLDALARTLQTRRVGFVRDVELAPGAANVVDDIAEDVRNALSYAKTAGVGIAWIAVGTNDEPGSDEINARMRADRARWLADALVQRGVANVRIAADDDVESAQARQRGAFLRMVPREASR